jgi:hypothetical protein
MNTNKKRSAKKKYVKPTMSLTQITTESSIANNSTVIEVELQDWILDTDAPAPYDGDIWVN